MTTYLFVTKPEYRPERVESKELRWSCSQGTKQNDHSFVYVTGVGICYEWRVLSDAEPDTNWPYMCDVEHVQTLDPPITLREIKDTMAEWQPPRQNFRGVRSIKLPDWVEHTIRTSRTNVDVEENEIILPEEIVDESEITEGVVRRVSVNAYERNPEARRMCIKFHGTRCTICRFDFEAVYGEAMKDYIHVHHLRPLSEVSSEYVVDPREDLRPVCPNCHAVIHQRNPPYTIDEVRAFLDMKQSERKGIFREV